MIKEATATALVFRRSEAGAWQVAMVWHHRFQGWIPPCGHVEADETAAEAAIRETLEEAGCRIRLVPGPAVPLPVGFPHRPVVAPWWVVEMAACADNHTCEPHIHVDHVFCGVWEADVGEPETQVRWLPEPELLGTPGIAEDSRMQVETLFAQIDDAVAT